MRVMLLDLPDIIAESGVHVVRSFKFGALPGPGSGAR